MTAMFTSSFDSSLSSFQSIPFNHRKAMTKKRWETIVSYKENFLNNLTVDPRQCSQIDPEVAASWLRSKQAGVNAFAPCLDQKLSEQEFESIREKNRQLIDVSLSLFKVFRQLANAPGYALYLFEKNGVFLLLEGDILKIPFAEYGSLVGRICDESTLGTCAHVLSMKLKRPVQLQGPEQYCIALQNLVASAAPIFDENGEIAATTVLCQTMVTPPWDKNFQNMCSHILCLITAIAAAIEAQLKLSRSNNHLQNTNQNLTTAHQELQIAYETLEATFACVDDIIAVIDKTGKIIRTNREGLRTFGFKPEDVGKRRITDYLDKHTCLMETVLKKQPANIEETIFVGKFEQSYVINIHPISNKSTEELDTAVLRFSPSEKVNAAAAKRTGATARFTFEDVIGQSPVIQQTIKQTQRFANSPENVLLVGESGTGKELFAQAIHNNYRPSGPFMAINCAAMPRELIESELFGYEGGSFTGAERTGRPGKIELASGGTLFLDEIGDMPFELQSVLLRVLEDKQVMRVGGRRYKSVDFRIIAATNKDLWQMVQEGLFREDLFFRLSVLSISIPPLRDREGDIELLADEFVKRYVLKLGRQSLMLDSGAKEALMKYNWPGNVRQLQNVVIYAVNNAQEDLIQSQDLPKLVNKINPVNQEMAIAEEVLSLEDTEKNAIESALKKTDNNVYEAALLLNIGKSTLYRKIKKYQFDVDI